MICGTCKSPYKTFVVLQAHWTETGCDWHRDTWERYTQSRKQGHSGRRILSQAYPHLYKSEPMPEEVKEKLRAATRERPKFRIPKRRRR